MNVNFMFDNRLAVTEDIIVGQEDKASLDPITVDGIAVDSFEDAFTRMTKTGYGSEPQVVNILVSPGIYSKTIKPNLIWEVDEDYGFGYYKLDGVAKLFALGIFTVEGTGDNVIFRCADGYNLDLKGGIDTTEWDQEAIRDTISHKNIIFDCDVILGSRSYEFTNCTFKKALYINGYDINDYWNLYYDTDCDIVNIYSFKDCTFEFDKGCNEWNCVTLTNQSRHRTGIVTADAVRFGGLVHPILFGIGCFGIVCQYGFLGFLYGHRISRAGEQHHNKYQRKNMLYTIQFQHLHNSDVYFRSFVPLYCSLMLQPDLPGKRKQRIQGDGG